MGKPTTGKASHRRTITLVLVIVSLLVALSALTIGLASASGVGTTKGPRKPECPAGRQLDLSVPSGPPGVAPTRDCISTPGRVEPDRVSRSRRDHAMFDGVPQLGYQLLGARIGQYWGGPQTLGIWGSIQTSNPTIPNGDGVQRHVVNSFAVLSGNIMEGSDTYAEVGWVKCNWSSSCLAGPSVFAFGKEVGQSDYQHYFYPQYVLQSTTNYYFDITYQGSGYWAVFIWWNGAWQPLKLFNLGFTFATTTWENWEVFDGLYDPYWYVPSSWFGHPNGAGIKIFDPAIWDWRMWDSSIPTSALTCAGAYKATWAYNYYSWTGSTASC